MNEHSDASQSTSPSRMGERFIQAGLLTPAQIEQISRLQAEEQLRFGEAAIKLGFLRQDQVLAVLNEQYNYATALTSSTTLSPNLSIAHAPSSAEAEAVRKIRTALLGLITENQPFSIAIASPRAGEGKSYLAASLAIAFSQSGQKTVLVNADLRTASPDRLHGLAIAQESSRQPAALSSILAGRSSLQELPSVPGFPSLSVLDAGPLPPNPQELLNEPRLRNLILALHQTYQIVILDTPPARESDDASIIVRQSDACLLVGRQDWSKLREMESLRDALLNTGTQIAGVVYNAYGTDSRSWHRSVRLP
ncbi:MAG: polysaccharide biosynthesis tyrosine autokinase [Pigmentiphaga sp.]|uniref:Chain length determinant protein tyrosine kinase EpsG n=1 Tax=Pigmentiphaga daeguensis TaxID=414049 RepID=A0ABN1BT66_9BURK